LSSDQASELQIRVNGWHAAWPGDFWQDPGRDVALRGDGYRRANTSVSLLVRRGAELLLHVLVDVGMGALNSLLDFQYQTRINRVDALLLTHPHFDHIAGLDWLANMVRRSNVADQTKPLPLYCSAPCYEEAIGRRFVWLKDLYEHRPVVSGEAIRIEGRDGAALRILPMAVWHGPTAPGALIYRVDDEQRRHSIVLAWDMLRLADGVDDGPLHNVDLLFIDSTSWHPQTAGDDPTGAKNHNTWHGSIEEWLGLLPAWRPKRTYFIHYGGSSDIHAHAGCADPVWASINGPMDESDLRAHVSRAGDQLKLDLRVPRHAMLIPVDEPWP
jgi:glyoxylase-like metal-dependent hydrolase (beta-lactamase superfamily II)